MVSDASLKKYHKRLHVVGEKISVVLKSRVDGLLFTVFCAILSVCWSISSRSTALIFLRTTWEGFWF